MADWKHTSKDAAVALLLLCADIPVLVAMVYVTMASGGWEGDPDRQEVFQTATACAVTCGVLLLLSAAGAYAAKLRISMVVQILVLGCGALLLAMVAHDNS